MKNLLLSTAIVAVSASAAQAQTAAAPQFMTEVGAQDMLASNFIGMRVYSSDAPYTDTMSNGPQKDWNDIGEINDVVLNRDGKVDGVLVDVGGFLGMGEHQVAVSMDAIKMVDDDSTANDPRDFFLVINATKDTLEKAPEFKRPAAMATNMANNGAAAVNNSAAALGTAATTGAAAVGAAASTDGAAVGDVANGTMATGTAAMGTMANGGMSTPMNDKANWTPVDSGTITSEQLTGASVYDGKDADIGEISSLVLAADGKVDEAVIDVGGFLGMGEKPVALKMSDLQIMKENNGDTLRVYVSQTKEQLEAMPDYKKP